MTTKTRSVGEYDTIKVVGFLDVYLEKGTESQITVTTDENLHEYLKIEVQDNTLILKTKEEINIKTQMGVRITVPFEIISKLALVGSGNIESKDTISVNNFDVSVTGSGNIIFPVKTIEFKALVAGSGGITVAGTATDAEVKLLGSGDFNGFNLNAQNTKVSISGSGEAELIANKNLIAKSNGSGDITVAGSASNVEIKLSGSGDFNGFNLNSQNTKVSISGSGEAKVVANESLVARINGSGNIVYKGNPENKDFKTSGSGDISSY